MSYGFYKINSKILKFDSVNDAQKIIFNHYLMRKENYARMNQDFTKGHFPLTVRIVAKDLSMSVGAVHRMIKEFEKLKIIELVENGFKNKKYSIYKYLSEEDMEIGFGTCFGTYSGTSKKENIKRELKEYYQLEDEDLDSYHSL